MRLGLLVVVTWPLTEPLYEIVQRAMKVSSQLGCVLCALTLPGHLKTIIYAGQERDFTGLVGIF